MCTALGTTVVSYDTVKNWYQKLGNKNYDVQEAEFSGRSTDVNESRLFLVLLAAFTLNLQVTGATYVDSVVTYCENNVRRLQLTEGRYVKGERKRNEPVLNGPQIKELLRIVYAIDQKQRVFECIGDMLYGNSSQNLEASEVYATLVQNCLSEKPATPQCDPTYPYKSLNGTCNNIFYPTRGSTLDCFRRLLPANYEGVSGMRKSVQGERRLPKPRSASLNIVKPWSRPTSDYNALFVFFGQAVAHDLGEFQVTPIEGDEQFDCCRYARTEYQHPQCAPILPEPDDPFYSAQNVSCLSVVRMAACHSCSIDKRIQINQVTSYIDCSLVYGQTDERAKRLRKNDGSGKLMTQHTKAGELLPAGSFPGASFRCSREEEGTSENKQYCFEGGDTRTDQHAVIAMFHTLLLREHNRLAERLRLLNPQWVEEKLYQEARKILIAEFQIIIYKEFLPVLIGQKLMTEYGLNIGGGSNYDFTVDPSLSVEFNAAAFRLHSLVPGKVVDGEEAEYLKFLYVNVAPLYEGKIDSFVRQMSKHPAEKYDWFLPTDLTHWFCRQKFGTYGYDLAAVDIQRGRDVGLPTYPQVIEYLENRPGTIRTFDDLKQYLVPECQRLLEETYSDVGDIDLWIGLNCERVPDDMIISPTAAEIIAEQFQRLKYGDRFFVEHNSTLTDEQRQTLRNASLAKLICDNSNVDFIQPMAMLFASFNNSRRLCSAIPDVDLEKWIE